MYLLVIVLFVAVYFLIRSNIRLRKSLSEVLSKKQSLSTKYGLMTEQFMPFLDMYPYDANSFRFLGNPVDGVQFNPDGVVFVEFKAGSSELTKQQKEVKRQVEEGKVCFKEFRINVER